MKRDNASAYVHMKCDTPPPPSLYGAVYMLKYDGNINDYIEIFQSYVVVEMWVPPDYFVWGLDSPVSKQWN